MSVSWAHSPPAELRAHHARDAAERAGPLPDDVRETSLSPEGAFQGGQLFTPTHCVGKAIIVYFHGGGFVAGSPETHRCVTAWLAQVTGRPVLSARYRLAPEHAFPAQQEDAAAACEIAGRLSEGAGLFLAGDSAGACVALWGLRALPPARREIVKGLVLFYGAFGLRESDSIIARGTAENGLDAETLAIMYRRLGANGPVWPIDFAQEITEPAYVLGAGLDAVLDDSVKLASNLRPAGTSNLFVRIDGQDHGFLKATGKDSAALCELEKAARWIATLGEDSNATP